MKKVLIITYYWPPSGGSGVQRWLYFTKYLRTFGWEPIIYTMKDADYPISDVKLLLKIPEGITVLKAKGFEPFKIYKSLTGQKNKRIPNSVVSKKDYGFMHKLAVWVRGNFFIPDARKFWIRPSVAYLSKFLATHKIDVLVSTSPPQSSHLIALAIHKKFNIPWLADFRDPWTKISYFNDLKLTSFARNKHIELEKKIVQSATELVTVTPKLKREFEALRNDKVHLITNGFDDEIKIPPSIKNNKFTLSYFGVLSEERNPVNTWKAIEYTYENHTNFADAFELILIGNIDISIINHLKKYAFNRKITYIDYLSHEDIFSYYAKSDVLLSVGIPGEKGLLPGKVFEYLSIKKPILNIGESNSDLQNFLSTFRCGLHANFNDYKTTLLHIEKLWELKKANRFSEEFNFSDENISLFTRKNLTKQLSELLNNMIKQEK